MSHIVEIKTQVRDPVAVQAACQKLSLPCPTVQTVQLFAGHVQGLAIQLPGWSYPVVCDLQTGELRYDNFNGAWGDAAHLDAFLQAYATEKTKLEARRQGYHVTEQLLADGAIRLTIHVPGGDS